MSTTGTFTLFINLLVAVFSQPTNTWLELASLNTPRQEVASAEVGGQIFVFGGFTAGAQVTNTVEVYDPALNQWNFTTPMPTDLHHPTAAVVNGKIYVIGGWTNVYFVTPSPLLLEFDPVAATWTEKARIPFGGRGASVATVLDGRIYVTGGWPADISQQLIVYDPLTDQWQQFQSMSVGRNHHGATTVNGRVYVIGGREQLGTPGDEPNTASVEVYNPVTGVWEDQAPMLTARSGIGCTSLGNFIFAIGGEGNRDNPDGTYQDNDMFDTLTNSWTKMANMPLGKHGIGTCSSSVDGAIHVTAGGHLEGLGPSSTHFVYVFMTDTFKQN